MSNLIKKAIISEKSFKEAAASKFTFLVDKSANKACVAAACEELFGVNVLEVNVTNIKGKVKMTKRVKGKRSDYKKAIVTVKKGQKIDLFEIEAPEEAKAEKKAKVKKEKEEKTDVKTVVKKKGKEITE